MAKPVNGTLIAAFLSRFKLYQRAPRRRRYIVVHYRSRWCVPLVRARARAGKNDPLFAAREPA